MAIENKEGSVIDAHDALVVENTEDKTSLSFRDTKILDYTKRPDTENNLTPIRVDYEDVKGFLYLNPDIFKTKPPKISRYGASSMINLAKGFFDFGRDRYFALVQYLPFGRLSSEHYHRNIESIVQLDGESIVVTRPIKEDTRYSIHELSRCQIIRISPETSHFLKTHKSESLTVPIKKVTKGKKDRFYQPMSDPRIHQELTKLKDAHYNNGSEFVNALLDFYNMLEDPNERIRFISIIDKEILRGKRMSNSYKILRKGFKD
jgi:hypothetical protein